MSYTHILLIFKVNFFEHFLSLLLVYKDMALVQGTWSYQLASNHQAIDRAHYRVMLTLKADYGLEDNRTLLSKKMQ